MKTDNIYRYLSYGLIGLGIAAIAFNPGSSQADSSSMSETSSTFENSSSTSRKRHKINLNISNLEDIKVVEGDRVNVGDIISDKPTAWLRYALPKEPNYKPRSRG